MQIKDFKTINGKFDESIDAMLDSINQLSPMCEPTDMTDQIRNLDQLVRTKTEFNRSRNQFIDGAIKVGGTLASIVVLLWFEQRHVITTKTLSFVPKPRL